MVLCDLYGGYGQVALRLTKIVTFYFSMSKTSEVNASRVSKDIEVLMVQEKKQIGASFDYTGFVAGKRVTLLVQLK